MQSTKQGGFPIAAPLGITRAHPRSCSAAVAQGVFELCRRCHRSIPEFDPGSVDTGYRRRHTDCCDNLAVLPHRRAHRTHPRYPSATDSNHPGWPGSGAGASRANAADPPAEMGRTAETGNDARSAWSDSMDNTHSRRTPRRTHSWHDSPVSRASATSTGSAVRTSGDEGNRWPSQCRPSASRRRSPCTTMARTSRCAVGTESPTCRASSLDLMGVVSTASRIATTRSSTPTPVPRASAGEPCDALVPASGESLVAL